MAYIELNWRYMHERVNKFIHSVVDDIKKTSPQDRATTTWHVDLGNVSDNVFVTLIAFYESYSIDELDDDQIEIIQKENEANIFIDGDNVYILDFCIRRTTTSAMHEEYDYSYVKLKGSDDPLCYDHQIYETDDDALVRYQMEIIDDISRVNNYYLENFVTDKYDFV